MTNRRGLVVLAISTWAFTVCFAVWMMFGVRDRIAETLRALAEERGPRQYVSVLAGEAQIEGARIDAATSPLVQ